MSLLVYNHFSPSLQASIIINQLFPPSSRFIRVGGYRLLNSWLTYSKTTNNSPLLQLILLTLQKLPLKVDHLKQVLPQFIHQNTPPVHYIGNRSIYSRVFAFIFSQNNTAKLVKQLSKSAETEGQLACAPKIQTLLWR